MTLEVFFLCSNFFLYQILVRFWRSLIQAGRNCTNKKKAGRFCVFGWPGADSGDCIDALQLHPFLVTQIVWVRDVNLSNGEGPWNGCAVGSLFSHTHALNMSLIVRFFLDSSLNPIVSCFPRSFHCLRCHLGTWWGWVVSWRRWPWNIAAARTWRSSLRICSVV